ncbi:MAG: leucine-rich repeat protein [Paludibacter sp.]
MKKYFFILITISMMGLVQAQVTKNLTLVTAGSLSKTLTQEEKSLITDFNISGSINITDIVCMRDEMSMLANLDLTNANIEYTNINGSIYNANNIGGFSTGSPMFEKSSLKTVKLPSTLTSIESMAFMNCTGLTYVFIPSKVTSIGGEAFYFCSSLKSIVCLNSTPPAFNYPYNYLNNPTIYVPASSVNIYKSSNGWSLLNIVEYKLNVSTQSVNSITLNSASLTGTLDLIATTSVSAHGFCWNTSGSPTITDNKTDNGLKTTLGEFSDTISGLSANTKYYVKAYATDGERTVYGSEVSFTTASMPDTAGIISGAQTVCQGQSSVTYTVPTIAFATSYIWTLPTGIVGTSYTNSITVKYERYFTTGSLTVKGHNEWGDGIASKLDITANLLPVIAGAISGNKTVCQGENSVTYTVPAVDNATSYKWVLPSGATGSSTTNSITVNYTKSAISGNITVKGHNDCGDGNVSYSMVTVNQLPIIELRDTALMSGGSVILYPTISYTGSGKLKYKWTPSTGLDNDTIAHPFATVTSNITYTLVVTTASGCSTSADVKVNLLSMAQPEIGIVGVISSNKNMIVWNKPVTTGIASYYIYRETNTSNVFEKIGTVPYDSLSVFVDNQSFPEVKSNKYKLSIFDNNGMESPLSNAHKTMHLSINKGQNTTWNLIWEPYLGFNVSTYNIYRGTTINNLNFLDATSGSSNQYSDLTAPTGDVFYQLEVISPNLINPTKVPASIQKSKKSDYSAGASLLSYNSSRSNIVTNSLSSVNELDGNNIQINIYPNPVKNQLRIDFEGGSTFEILNLMGQVVYNGDLIKSSTVQTSSLCSGVYMIKFKTGKTFEYRKIIKE